MNLASLVLALGLTLQAGGSGAGEHLLAGARLFREARYAEALVEFRVAQRLGSPDAAGYAGAALVKLGRPEEAFEAFGGADAPRRDALLDYYRAIAAFDARLYATAERLLSSGIDRPGPRVADEVARLRADLATVLAATPAPANIDWYLERCAATRAERRLLLSRAFCAEATALAQRRPDHYRLDEARRGAAAAPTGSAP